LALIWQQPTTSPALATSQAFNAPIHPAGIAPVHAATATQAQITETNRQHAADLSEHNLYNTVMEEIKKQILAAVPNLYLTTILADHKNDMLGFADVTCAMVLAHLRATFGTVTQEELEENRNGLSAEWSPDNPMEHLWWVRIIAVQRFATVVGRRR
jgi:hypothetical protein